MYCVVLFHGPRYDNRLLCKTKSTVEKKKLTKTFRVITKNSTFLFTDKYNKNLNQITNITQSKQ